MGKLVTCANAENPATCIEVGEFATCTGVMKSVTRVELVKLVHLAQTYLFNSSYNHSPYKWKQYSLSYKLHMQRMSRVHLTFVYKAQGGGLDVLSPGENKYFTMAP